MTRTAAHGSRPGRLEHLERAQAGRGLLGERQRDAHGRRQIAGRERLVERREQRGGVGRSRSSIRESTSISRRWPGSRMKRRPRTGRRRAHVVLAAQQDLDRQVRVREQRRERHEALEDRGRARALRRRPRREHLAVRVHAHDPPLRRYGVDDADPMAIEQRVQLRPQRGETARLDLDQLAVGAHDVDHVAVDTHLEDVAVQPLQLAVQRAFAELADHAAKVRASTRLTFCRGLCILPPRFPKPFSEHGRKSHNPRARAAQRRVRRHRVTSPQRLRRRASRDARAHHAPRVRARLHAGRRRPQPGHPALARHRRVPGDRRGPSGPPASRSSTRCSGGSSSVSEPRASTCCCSPPSAPATATARTPTSSARATTTSTAAR